MRTRALTTSEAVAKLIAMGVTNLRCTKISDNEITRPLGETTGDVYYSVSVAEYSDGESYLHIYRFVKNYWKGEDLGANGRVIFDYAKANAREKKLFMEIMEKEFNK